MAAQFRKIKENDAKRISEMCHFRTSTMSIMEFEGLGREFDDEEELDRNDDLPIDPIWEAQQISTFTAWCNAHLRKTTMKIESFEHDFRNGLKLMKLLEIISGEVLPTPDKGRMRFHKLANVNKALKFIENKGVKLASIGAEEIVDGNVKMTLGMVWTIILRFTIQDIFVEDSSAKEGLLLWCKRKTNGYKHINIINFKNSFQDGLVFCGLIHSQDPSLLNYDELSPRQPRENLNLAFSLASKHFDVPPMLNIDDMVGNQDSDERSIMAYVSSYYHAFIKKDKVASAIDMICSIISQKILEENTAGDFKFLYNNLLIWVERMIIEFGNTSVLFEADQLKVKEKLFSQYKEKDKPKHLSEKLNYNYFCVLKNCEFDKLEELKKKWVKMENMEVLYEKYLVKENKRLEQIGNLLENFDLRYKSQNIWLDQSLNKLMKDDYEFCDMCQLNLLRKKQELFNIDLAAHQPLTEKIVNIVEELRKLDYNEIDSVEKKVDSFMESWNSLQNHHEQRLININKLYNALNQIDEMQLDFAQRIIPLYNWIKQSNRDLNDRFILHFVDDIKERMTVHENFKLTLQEANSELNSIICIGNNIEDIAQNCSVKKIPINPYTDIEIQELKESWNQLQQHVLNREDFLKKCLYKQLEDRKNIKKYREMALEIFQELETIQHSLLDFLSNIREKKNYLTVNTDHSQLNKLNGDIKCCINLLNTKLTSLLQNCSNSKINDSEDRIIELAEISAIAETLSHQLTELIKSSTESNLNGPHSADSQAKRISEYQECFKYFDKSNSGHIDEKQFHSCLLSLGFELEENKETDKQFNNLMSKLDPQKTGFISLNKFIDYLESESSKETIANNSDSKDKILQQSFQTLANNERYVDESLLREKLPKPVADYCITKMMPPRLTGEANKQLDFSNL